MEHITRIPFILFILLLTHCQTVTTVDSPYVEKGNIIYYDGEKTNDVIVHMNDEPEHLHPTFGTSGSSFQINYYLHHPLLRIDISSGNLIPILVEDLPDISDNNLSYHYLIHEKAAWSDGTPITTKDVLFSFKMKLCGLSPVGASTAYFDFFESIIPDPEDPRKFEIKMSDPYILNAYLVTEVPILDQRFYDPEALLDDYSLEELRELAPENVGNPTLTQWADKVYGTNYGREVEFLKGGAGPYEVESWESSQQLVLKRKENYWAQALSNPIFNQYPEYITFKFVQDPQALELEIKQQEIDVSTQLTADVFERLQNSPVAKAHYTFANVPRMSPAMILLNTQPDGTIHKLIFNENEIRKALAKAMPVQEVIDQFFSGSAVRTASMIAPTHSDYNRSLSPITFDPQNARKILEEEGWADDDGDGILDKIVNGTIQPLEFSLTYPATARNKDIVEKLRIEVGNVGFKLIPNPVNMGQLVQALTDKNFDAVLLSLTHGATPYDFNQIWHSSQWPKGQNFTGYTNTTVDSLIDLSRVTMGIESRKAITAEIQRIFSEDLPAIPLFSPSNSVIIHKRFNNATIHPYRYYILLNNLKINPLNQEI